MHISAAAAEAFLDRIESDEPLAQELSALRADPAAVQARVQALGFDASTEEVRAAFLSRYGAELDEAQLAAVAGGVMSETDIIAAGVTGGLLVLSIAASAAAAF